jgi:ActR/RegA family two-component response regulator
MDELLKAIKKQIADMKKIELTGFTNTETATAYFQDASYKHRDKRCG